MDSIEERLVECEQDLIKLKTQGYTSADSSKLYRTYIDFSSITSTRKYTIELAPIDGNYEDLIVMPIASTGDVNNVSFFSSGIGLDFEHPYVIHFERVYDSTYPKSATSLMVYSNRELYIKSQTYT